jgi:hypothetical protein
MGVRLLFLLAILSLLAGCAPGYYDTPQAAYQPEPTRQWHTNPYTNPETEREYQRRIWWENYESERPRFWRR